MTTRQERRDWPCWMNAIYVSCAVAAGLAAYVFDTVTGRRP